MASSRYPTDEEARATFTDETLVEAIRERLAKRYNVTLVRFDVHTEGNEMMVFDSKILTRIADLIDDLPYECVLENNEIVRRETFADAEKHVISSRRSDMHYSESSPYYAVHLRVSSDE